MATGIPQGNPVSDSEEHVSLIQLNTGQGPIVYNDFNILPEFQKLRLIKVSYTVIRNRKITYSNFPPATAARSIRSVPMTPTYRALKKKATETIFTHQSMHPPPPLLVASAVRAEVVLLNNINICGTDSLLLICRGSVTHFFCLALLTIIPCSLGARGTSRLVSK